MSTIPNQVSSERSTAQTMDVSTSAHEQGNSDAYADNPTTGEARRAGASGNGAPSTSYRGDASTSERDMADYRSYRRPAQESERGPDQNRTEGIRSHHLSYSAFSTPNPAKPTRPPAPPTSNNNVTLRTPSSASTAYPQHPPIATLDTTSPVEPHHPPSKRKAMYDPPTHVSNGPPAPSPSTVSSASPSTSAQQAAKDAVKRTKTSRACDPCRRKKIRRVLLPFPLASPLRAYFITTHQY